MTTVFFLKTTTHVRWRKGVQRLASGISWIDMPSAAQVVNGPPVKKSHESTTEDHGDAD